MDNLEFVLVSTPEQGYVLLLDHGHAALKLSGLEKELYGQQTEVSRWEISNRSAKEIKYLLNEYYG